MRILHRTTIAVAIAVVSLVPALASPSEADVRSPVVGMASTPSGGGQWTVQANGTVRAYGAATALGSVRRPLNRPITGMAPTPSGRGYWLVAEDGGIFSFGDAVFHGSTGAMRLNQPITGMASTPSGRGYWLVAEDGGIFSFGDAVFHGSTGAMRLNQPIIAMAPTPSGRGYWLLASDGGVFRFGDARFFGSTGALRLNSPIVGMASTRSGRGYWLVGADGGVFSFGEAPFLGSGTTLPGNVVGIAARASGGYRVVSESGRAIDLNKLPSTLPTSPAPQATPSVVGPLPFPGPGSVGHLANLPGYNVPATNLTPYDGNYVTSRDGEVVEAMDISGSVIVRNRDVIIRRNRIGLGVAAMPNGDHPSVSARVEWSTIGPERGVEAAYLFGNGRGENLTFYRNEIFGGIDLFNFNDGGNVTIRENWAYGPYQMLDDPYQQDNATTKSHNDGIQVFHGGAHYHVIGNRFDLFLFRGYRWDGEANRSKQVALSPRPTARSQIGVFENVAPMTTGFLFQQGNGRLDDIVFDGNRIDGDYYRALSFEKGDYSTSATNVRIVNNTFVRRYPEFGRSQLIGASTPSNVVFDNNVDESGRQIPTPDGMKG